MRRRRSSPRSRRRLGEYAARQLAGRGIDIRDKHDPRAAGDGWARLSDGETIPSSTLVWTPGPGHPLVAELGLPLDDAGADRVDEFCGSRVARGSGRWATAPGFRTRRRRGRPDPPTSQHALRQARRLAKNLRGDLRPYRYRMLGQVATLGRYKGIADVLGVRIHGFPGWFVTRSYHLYQLPLLSRKLRVVVDWTVSLFFRRDIAELGALGRPTRLGDE